MSNDASALAVSTQQTHEGSARKGWPSLLLSIAVIAAAVYSFTPRPHPPFPPTELRPDRLLVTDLAASGSGFVAVGEQGRILRAAAAGGPWTEATVQPQRESTLTRMLVLPDGALLAVGHDGWILRSSDGGASWKEVAYNTPAPASAADAIPDPFADSESEEAAAPAQAQSDPLLGIAGPYEGKLYAIGGFGLFMSSADLGRTWQRELHQPLGDRHLYAMTRAEDGSLWIAGERGLLARSVDAGASWAVQPEFYNGSFYGMLTLPTGDLFVFGMRGNAFLSQDQGATWQQSRLPMTMSLQDGAVAPDGSLVLVGASDTIFVSTDGGRNFRLASQVERTGLTAVVPLKNGAHLVAGEGGIRLREPKAGKRAEAGR